MQICAIAKLAAIYKRVTIILRIAIGILQRQINLFRHFAFNLRTTCHFIHLAGGIIAELRTVF